jgi:hypothetical protein
MRSVAVHSDSIYDRWYFLAIFAVAYVALAALAHAGPRVPPVVVLVGSPLLLGWVWRQTRRPAGLAGRGLHATALTALRVCSSGSALWIAARLGPVGRPAFDMAANVGLGCAVVAASVALARIPEQAGLIKPPRSARSLDAAAFCALLWGIACALPAARTLWPGKNLLLDPLATDYATSAASLGSVLVLIGAALRLRFTRRLELGVMDRASGAIALSLTAFSVAIPAAAANLAAPDRALPLGALTAALGCAWTATTREPTSVSRALRAALVVMFVGAPVALTAGALAQNAPQLAGVFTVLGCAAAVVVGLVARALAEPFTPEQSRWLRAFQAATRAALDPEPDAAIMATLKSLQGLEKSVHTRPELWRVDPPQVLSVDVAGYLHTQAAVAPPELFELARLEPERMLRHDVLTELEVRRPEVRSILGWMEARQAFAVTLVCEEQTPLGLLLLPRGARTRPVSLEEARAARQLADRLSAVLSVSSSLVRAREREQAALQRAEALAEKTLRLEAFIAEQTRPRDLLVDALAGGVRVATYSARVRLTLEALERLGALGQDVTLLVPVGADPVGWACVFHLASERRRGPLVIVDATAASAHQAAYWSDPLQAPTLRAEAGNLVLLNVAALPHAAQDALAIALSRRAGSSGAGGAPGLLATLPRSPEQLLEERHLSRALAQFLLPHVLGLPPLAERAEDLRALIMDRLCRSGVRFGSAPLGIEPQALGILVDYSWPGNEAELRSVVDRAAHAAKGERVSLADLASVGFCPPSAQAAEPLPSSRPRRGSASPTPTDDGDAEPTTRSSLRRRRRR